jgi:hypothetical protein
MIPDPQIPLDARDVRSSTGETRRSLIESCFGAESKIEHAGTRSFTAPHGGAILALATATMSTP